MPTSWCASSICSPPENPAPVRSCLLRKGQSAVPAAPFLACGKAWEVSGQNACEVPLRPT